MFLLAMTFRCFVRHITVYAFRCAYRVMDALVKPKDTQRDTTLLAVPQATTMILLRSLNFTLTRTCTFCTIMDNYFAVWGLRMTLLGAKPRKAGLADNITVPDKFSTG